MLGRYPAVVAVEGSSDSVTVCGPSVSPARAPVAVEEPVVAVSEQTQRGWRQMVDSGMITEDEFRELNQLSPRSCSQQTPEALPVSMVGGDDSGGTADAAHAEVSTCHALVEADGGCAAEVAAEAEVDASDSETAEVA